MVHWAGPPEQAQKILKPFRDVAPIVANGAGPLPYPALNAAFDPLYPKGIRAYWKGAFVAELPAEAIAAHLEHGSRVPEVSATMHLYPNCSRAMFAVQHGLLPEETSSGRPALTPRPDTVRRHGA